MKNEQKRIKKIQNENKILIDAKIKWMKTED